MCGIVGAVAPFDVVPFLMNGLQRLEYRGYDSAGMAIIGDKGLNKVRAVGRVSELAAHVHHVRGDTGIAHTRWATHGEPSVDNAHPVQSGSLVLVHNGIIENYLELKDFLLQKKIDFAGETDTEVVVHLIHWHCQQGLSTQEAFFTTLKQLEGAFALLLMDGRHPHQLWAATRHAPLVAGYGAEAHYVASDVMALAGYTQKVSYFSDNDIAHVNATGITFYDGFGHVVKKAIENHQLTLEDTSLGVYQHYMQKEIFEQPKAIADTLENVRTRHSIGEEFFGPDAKQVLDQVQALSIVACGTSFYAGLVGRYWIEDLAGIPVSVEVASEYRYRQVAHHPNHVVLAISQSGETADTLAAFAHHQSDQALAKMVISNVANSSLMRQAKLRFLTRAGPELGVASTKAFITQLAALYVLALVLAKSRGRLSPEKEKKALVDLSNLPHALTQAMQVESQIKQWAQLLAPCQHALFLGRGIHYPVALEGALKLKELAYIHAEAYPAGELKHGPLALVDSSMPVLAIAPDDALFIKLKSNLSEVRSRGGQLMVLADSTSHIEEDAHTRVIRLHDHAGDLSPLLHTLPLQLLAYHTALMRGNDVDRPRNLAKSVTVE